MRKKFNLVLLMGLVVSQAALRPSFCSAASWEDEKKAWEEFANNPREKDPGYAAKLSLNFLPVDNGHFYVGEVSRGIWFSVGQTASLVAVVSPYLSAQSRAKQDKDPIWTTSMIVTAAMGGAGYLILKVWSAFDAAEGARRYNKAIAEKKQAWQWGLQPRGGYVAYRWSPKTEE